MIWIAFEGPDYVGKTTQVGLMEDHFSKGGRTVVRYSQPHQWIQESRDPFYTFMTRRLLLHADNEIVMELIKAQEKYEVVVLTDRWHPLSEKVYSEAGGKDEADFSTNLMDAVNMIRDRFGKPHPRPNIVVQLGDKTGELEERFKERKKEKKRSRGTSRTQTYWSPVDPTSKRRAVPMNGYLLYLGERRLRPGVTLHLVVETIERRNVIYQSTACC